MASLRNDHRFQGTQQAPASYLPSRGAGIPYCATRPSFFVLFFGMDMKGWAHLYNNPTLLADIRPFTYTRPCPLPNRSNIYPRIYKHVSVPVVRFARGTNEPEYVQHRVHYSSMPGYLASVDDFYVTKGALQRCAAKPCRSNLSGQSIQIRDVDYLSSPVSYNDRCAPQGRMS
jgi:hypothetical protein